MPFLSTYIDVRTVNFFPPAESWLVNSNFPRASRMQGKTVNKNPSEFMFRATACSPFPMHVVYIRNVHYTCLPSTASCSYCCGLRTADCGLRLSPPQRFKRSLYQSAVWSVPQAQSRMDRSGGEPLPDVCRFLVHPCRFLVRQWISRLWLNLTAWNSQKPIANYVATVCICFFEV